MEILSKNPKQTKELGLKLANELKGGETVELIGDLGSGKTTFAQGLAEGLGITRRVLSPTFIIRRSYRGRLNLEHLDFYRLNGPGDILGLGLEEIVGDPTTVVVMEWPERVGLNQKNARKIRFEYVDGQTRKITL